jgi:sigma-B regulation protein RsbU (phosphoserine phosphatase)
MAGLCVPARGIGGDYYDFLELQDGRLGLALADVAGKGIAAALIMSVVQASLRSLTAGANGSLADLAGQMNRLLIRCTRNNSYATFFYGEFDEKTNKLRYVNAGHNPPLLLRASVNGQQHSLAQARQVDGESQNIAMVDTAAPAIEELKTGGMVIGLFAQAPYEEGEVQLAPGDLLITFSDGVTEALNPAEEEFGEERLKELLQRYSELSVADISSRILADLREWIAAAPQHDDMTFVLLKILR